MPAQKNAHGRTGRLVRGHGALAHLAEPGSLGRHGASGRRPAGAVGAGGGGAHALVPVFVVITQLLAISPFPQGRGTRRNRRCDGVQILHQNIQTLATPLLPINPLQHGRHLARLDALEDFNDGMQVRLLGRLGPVVHGHLQTSAQGALGVATPEQLSYLPIDGARVGLADFGQGGVKRGDVEVDGRVLGQGVDVDGAPGVAERCLRVLLDDGHCGCWLWFWVGWLVGWLVTAV